jgi:hypothetical protein
MKLAKALNVSTKFLRDDNCITPMAEIEKDGYIAEARERYNNELGRVLSRLQIEVIDLFSGSELPEAVDFTELREELSEIKGVGEKRLDEIMSVIERHL